MFSVISRKAKPIDIRQSFENYCNSKNDKHVEVKEPKAPVVKTDLPGPKTKQLIDTLKSFQNVLDIDVFANYEKSFGNFLTDADENVFLDVQMDYTPLGYNHPQLRRIFEDPLNLKYIVNKPITGVYPGDYWTEKIKYIVEKVSPNLPNVATFQSESSAVENAFKAIMLAFQKHQRGGLPVSKEELDSAIINQPPGSPKLGILSFQNADHGGDTIAALSASHADGMTKVDTPAFDWPIARFPAYKYPLEQFDCYNRSQDKKCLDMVEDLIDHWERKGIPIVGIIVEPIQNFCTCMASPQFFQRLQDIANRKGIFLLIDETRTGCGTTGKFWCHEHFCLKCPPDAVIFGGKAQLPGFFHSLDLSSQECSKLFERWMGDPAKLLMLETIINLLEKVNMLEQIRTAGEKFQNCLMNLENDHYNLIHSTRGLGLFLAFDAQCPALRDNILTKLKKKGILCGKTGSKTISLRPSLTFSEKHIALFMDRLEQIIKETELIKSDKKKKNKNLKTPTKQVSKQRQECHSTMNKSQKADTQNQCEKKGLNRKRKKVSAEKKNKKAICPRPWSKDHKKLESQRAEHVEESKEAKSAIYETCGKQVEDKLKDGNKITNKTTTTEAAVCQNEENAESHSNMNNTLCHKQKDLEIQKYDGKKDTCGKKIKKTEKKSGNKRKSVCPRDYGERK